jgi:hypothetical protein
MLAPATFYPELGAARYVQAAIDAGARVFKAHIQVGDFPPSARTDLQVLGDRVLFGSDYPNIPYPYQHAVASLSRLELGREGTAASCTTTRPACSGYLRPPLTPRRSR